MKKLWVFSSAVLFAATTLGLAAQAEEASQPPAQTPPPPAAVTAPSDHLPATADGADEEAAAAPAAKKRSLKSGKRNSEKETDGSEASDRFEANTVIKSRYRVNGEQLEVDPD